MVPFLITVPPAMPGDICIEVLWVLLHSEVIDEDERVELIENLGDFCRDNLVAPAIPPRL